MKTAVIDIGTNTFNLLVKDTDTGEILISEKTPVKLGEGGINQNRIMPAAFERAMFAFGEYSETIRSLGAEEVYAFATSAVRGASNQKEFIEAAREKFGIAINLLNGLQEAEMIYQGVREAVPMGKTTHLIMDIGGGSTELVFGNSQEIFWKKSFDVGTGRLFEKHHNHDPITDEEVAQINKYLGSALAELKEQQGKYRAEALIGSSGSFETFADMVLAAEPTDNKTDGATFFEFDLGSYFGIAEKMVNSTLKQRLDTPGMIAMRADMIVMASLLTNFILKNLEIKRMKLSHYALKEGVIHSVTEKNHQWQKSFL